MIRKPSYRYYCEHCGKSSGSGGHMSRHEKSCTANPDRECRMCNSTRPIGSLIEVLGDGDEAGVMSLRYEAGGCPACMLAAIRQSGLQRPYEVDGSGKMTDEGFSVEFNFKEEKDRWWKEKNREFDDYA